MSEFRDWAVAVYTRPGVAEACLDLQDNHGQNVPLLLWAVWRGGEVAAAAEAARVWEDEVIAPLRGVRRRLKGRADADALRQRVRAVELEAELALMTELESLAGPVPDEKAVVKAVDAWGRAPSPEALERLRAAITGT